MLQQSDGKVLVVGTADGPIATTIFAARFTAAGVLDTAYGTAGIAYFDIPPDLDHLTASAAALDGAGNLVVAGQATPNGPIPYFTDVVVVRLLESGLGDPSFGVAGLARPPIPGFSGATTAAGVGVDSQGRIVVGGTAQNSNGGFLVLRLTPSGPLDTGFNGAGIRILANPYQFGAIAVAVTTADGILVAGQDDPFSNTPFAIFRLTSSGAQDAAFGGTGVVHLQGGVAIASDVSGNVLVASQPGPSFSDTAVATRLTSTGALDTAFGIGGSAGLSLGGRLLGPTVRTICLDGAGRIVLAADGFDANGQALAALRFTALGAPDSSFGGGGIEVVPTGIYSTSTVLRAGLGDGVFMASGYFSTFVAHLTAAGALDPAFDGTGSLTQEFGTEMLTLTGTARQSDGKLVILGIPGLGPSSSDFVVARLTLAGALDPTFNGTGFRILGAGGAQNNSIALDPSGRIVLAAPVYFPGGFRLTRLLDDGTLDSAFNGTGTAEVGGISPGLHGGHGLAVDSRGNVLLAGNGVARILSTGIVDAAFGTSGIAPMPVDATGDHNIAIVADSLDRPVIGGTASDGVNQTFAIARLMTSGSPDPAFGTAGVALVPLGTGVSQGNVDAMAIDSGGNIVVAGAAQLNASAIVAIARTTDTGVPDPLFNGSGVNVVPGTFGFPRALAFDPSGRIVVTGGGDTTRLIAGGSIDPTFNAGQTLVTSIVPGTKPLYTAAVVADSSGTYLAGTGGRTMAVVRLFDGPPTNLVMLYSGSGADVAATPFDLIVEAQDGAGNPQPIASATSVAIALSPSPPTLLGPTSCTIPAGHTFCVISGVAYPSAGQFQIVGTVTGGVALPFAPTQSRYVAPALVTVTINSHSPNPSVAGQLVTVSASVSAPSASVTPTGTVSIWFGSLSSPSCSFQLPATSCSFAPGVAGAFALVASYGGDSVFGFHNSEGVIHTVSPSSVPPALASAQSRRMHGSAGVFVLPLSLNPLNPTTEPRQGPTHSIVLNFDKPITSATASITEGTATVSSPFPLGTQMSLTLSGVADRQYVTISLTNLTSPDGSTGSASLRIGFLAGDVNQSRTVSLADLGLVNAVLAQPVTMSNYLRDVNASGTITIADKGITNANLTKSLSPP